MVGKSLNIFMEHDLNILMIFGIKEKCIILTHCYFGIATNIPVLLKTGFVLQGHKRMHACQFNRFPSCLDLMWS